MTLTEKYLNFIRGVSVNRTGKAGVVLATSSFVVFVFMELMRLAGILTNAYIGLISYLLLPTLFVIGLILIPIGWRKLKKDTGKSTKEILEQQFDEGELKERATGSRIFTTIAIFTVVNVLFMLLASFRMLDFMDKPYFCGTACHSVMNPEWVTYQASPHARVACVECHVGEGVGALIDSKLNGTWQMISVTFNLYEKPIPTPVHQLRPARETCEKCHWPEKFYGSKLKNIISYKPDSASTPVYTTLNLKIDTGTEAGKAGIHWHIGEENEIRYTSVNDERREMIWVEVKQPDGSFKRYRNTGLSVSEPEADEPRVMDCVDCHNRATHIYENPEKAIDKRIASGKLAADLPFIKRESLEAITTSYTTKQQGMENIAVHMANFYRDNYPNISASKQKDVDSAIAVLQNTFYRNIHPEMNIRWNVYPNHIGHDEKRGCFRCHNNKMVSDNGDKISQECTMCHSMLAYESDEPFSFLEPAGAGTPDSLMHEYLRQEFLESVQ